MTDPKPLPEAVMSAIERYEDALREYHHENCGRYDIEEKKVAHDNLISAIQALLAPGDVELEKLVDEQIRTSRIAGNMSVSYNGPDEIDSADFAEEQARLALLAACRYVKNSPEIDHVPETCTKNERIDESMASVLAKLENPPSSASGLKKLHGDALKLIRELSMRFTAEEVSEAMAQKDAEIASLKPTSPKEAP